MFILSSSEDAAAMGCEKPKFHPDCRIHGYHRADVKDYCDSDFELGLMADPANYPFNAEACAQTQVMTNVVPIVSIIVHCFFPIFTTARKYRRLTSTP